MASTIIRLICLFLIITTIKAERDDDLCAIEKLSYGLIPPPIPRNFEMKYESVDKKNTSVSWHEMYFDHDGLHGRYKVLSNGTEYNIIVSYELEQAVSYYSLHPGVPLKYDPMSEACVAVDIEKSIAMKLFGYKQSNRNLKSSRMFNSNEALRFGGPHPYSAQGFENLDDRGLNASSFKGCIYDKDDDITGLVYYYFSNDITVPAGGTPDSIVYGEKDNIGLLSVPLARAGTISSIKKKVGSNDAEIVYENFEHNIPWFKGDPDFPFNTFKIPEWMYCNNFRGEKDIPKLPSGFSTRFEMTSFTQDLEGVILTATVLLNYQVFYDYDKKLARLDFTPLQERDTDIISLFESNEPVRVVFDYNAGIKYIVHKSTGRCFAKPIDQGDMFDASDEGMYIRMGTPEEALQMQADEMEYKGKAITRDITSDVWIGKYLEKQMNVTVFKEIYHAADGWHEESDEVLKFGVPLRLAVITNRMEDGILEQTVTEKNFFKFKPTTPALMMFDIRGCIEHVEHKFYVITLSVANENIPILQRFKWDFQQAAQHYVSEASQIGSPLRIQRVTLRKPGTSLAITFAMLGKIPVKSNVPFGAKGLMIDEAFDLLKKHIDSGKFSFKFTVPSSDFYKDTDDIEIFALPGSLKQYDVKTQSFSDIRDFRNSHYADDKKPVTEDKPKTKKGMPAGGLAALAITMLIIGIALGITGMYLYIRKKQNEGPVDQYAMQKK